MSTMASDMRLPSILLLWTKDLLQALMLKAIKTAPLPRTAGCNDLFVVALRLTQYMFAAS